MLLWRALFLISCVLFFSSPFSPRLSRCGQVIAVSLCGRGIPSWRRLPTHRACLLLTPFLEASYTPREGSAPPKWILFDLLAESGPNLQYSPSCLRTVRRWQPT